MWSLLNFAPSRGAFELSVSLARGLGLIAAPLDSETARTPESPHSMSSESDWTPVVLRKNNAKGDTKAKSATELNSAMRQVRMADGPLAERLWKDRFTEPPAPTPISF